MTLGLAIFVVTLALRAASTNRHLRGRLMASAAAAAVYALIAASITYHLVSTDMQAQERLIQPLLLAFAVINSLVALFINPWRADRVPERFPTIVQDAIVLGLFVLTATFLLQERIFALTAAGAVVIGLALQDTLGNLFAGLALQIEKPFNVGHWVRIADIDGLVSEVTWRATKVRTKAGNFVVVPNSKASSDIIINYSEPSIETLIEVDVGVSYDAPPNRVKQVILEAIHDEPLILKSRPSEVLIMDFAASSINYRIRVWSNDFAADERLRDRIRSAVYYAFRRTGIEIPYPIQVEYSRQEQAATHGIGGSGRVVLTAVAIFASLTEAEREQLAAESVEALFAAGEVVVRQGDAGRSMFVVVDGEVKVTAEGDDREIARIGAGGFFGEMSLLTGAPRNATVRTVKDTSLIEITSDAFKRLVLANPEAVQLVGAAVAQRRAELEQRRAAGAPVTSEPEHSLVSRIRRFFGLDD